MRAISRRGKADHGDQDLTRYAQAAHRIAQALRRRKLRRGARRPESRTAARLLSDGDWPRGLQPGDRGRAVVLHRPRRGPRRRLPRAGVWLLAAAVEEAMWLRVLAH